MKMKKRKKWYKNPAKGKIFGVCMGLAEKLNVDPIFIRLIFLGAFFFPPLFFVYLLLAFLLERKPDYLNEEESEQSLQISQIPAAIQNVEQRLSQIDERVILLESAVTSQEFIRLRN